VQIWNPWGSDGAYKELDVTMKQGFFTMPVSAFVERCNNVMFEIAEDAPLQSKYIDQVGGHQVGGGSGGRGGAHQRGGGHKQRGG
jgi:hypothetical protein